MGWLENAFGHFIVHVIGTIAGTFAVFVICVIYISVRTHLPVLNHADSMGSRKYKR